MKDEYGRVQTYAQAMREMNTRDMAVFIVDFVKDISGVKIGCETVREKLEQPTEKTYIDNIKNGKIEMPVKYCTLHKCPHNSNGFRCSLERCILFDETKDK